MPLKLASNYATFFERVVTPLDRLDVCFREYESILTLLKGERGRTLSIADPLTDDHDSLSKIEAALCGVYTDLFEFFRGIAKIFKKSDGREYRVVIKSAS